MKTTISNKIKHWIGLVIGERSMVKLKNLRNNIPFLKKMRFSNRYSPNTLFFVISPYNEQEGLSDRFKGIVTCYYYAKKFGYQLKIVFKTPFVLEDYVLPNKVDWVAGYEDLHYSIGHTRFFDESNIFYMEDFTRVRLKPGKEYHCYNIGNRQPDVYPGGYAWGELYNELFKPSESLRKWLDSYPFKEKQYIAVHIRFVNVLEEFERPTIYSTPLETEEEKQRLIARCKVGVMDLKRMNGDCEVLVFSDSKRFLSSLDDIPVHVLGGQDFIAHSRFTGNKDATMKTFVDLYMISRAKKVYRITAKELYNLPGFAKTAALIGGLDYETFEV